MKEILGKCTTKSSTLLTKITVNKTDIFDTKKQLMNSINFLQTLELIWQIKKQMHQSDFYVTKVNASMESQPLSINELKDAFFAFKINKSASHDEVSFNVMKNFFGEL